MAPLLFPLLPVAIDERAMRNPAGPFAQFPLSNTYSAGFGTATNAQVANAINHVTGLLVESFGKSNNFETIAYIGPGDLRYSIIVVAAIKAGYKTFLPSPRNSLEAHLSLLRRLECTKLVYTSPAPPCVPIIEAAIELQTLVIPSLAELLALNKESVKLFPYEKEAESARKDPIYVLHTSGSTGELPIEDKLIPLSN